MASVPIIASGLVPMMQRYYDKLFLERLQNFQKYNFLAVQKTFPKNSGKIVYFTRMAQLSAQTAALTDGTSPTSNTISADSLIATCEPWGAHQLIGRQYELTTLDAGLKEHVEMMAQNAGETLDFQLGKALCNSAANTPLTANSVEVASLASTDTLTVSGIRTAVAKLKINKAPKWDNGNYRAVVNCDGVYQLQGDTAAGNWININMYNSDSNAELLKKGVIGTLYGVDIVETNVAFCASDKAGGVSATGRSSFFAGKGAVAEVKLQGNGDAKIIYKQTNDNDTSNPLNMYSTLGWKIEAYAAKVLNSDWLINYTHYGTMTASQGATA